MSGRQCLMCLVVLLSACAAPQTYKPQPLDALHVFDRFTGRDLHDPALREFLHRHGYTTDEWPLGTWDVDALTLAALYYNPALDVAVAEWQLRLAGETTAAQRPNPLLDIPAGWYVDSEEEGRSPLLLGMVLDLIWERPDKRRARIDQAELQTAAARMELKQVAWDIRSGVHQAIADLLASRHRLESLQQRAAVIDRILELLQRRAELGQVAAFELSASRLEMQRLRLELTAQQTHIKDTRGRLAAAIGVPPTVLQSIAIHAPDRDFLPEREEIPETDLRGLALQNRYDIRRALAEYAAQEAALRLEIEKQYPDINLSPGFIFDQGDSIWELGAAWVLPLFHRHEGEIAEAMARRTLLQQRFLQLQAGIIDRVYRARTDYLGKLNTWRQAAALTEQAAEHQRYMDQQLQAGYSDRLQYLRAQQALAEAEQALRNSRTDLLRSFAQLEAELQYPVRGRAWSEKVIASMVDEKITASGDGKE